MLIVTLGYPTSFMILISIIVHALIIWKVGKCRRDGVASRARGLRCIVHVWSLRSPKLPRRWLSIPSTVVVDLIFTQVLKVLRGRWWLQLTLLGKRNSLTLGANLYPWTLLKYLVYWRCIVQGAGSGGEYSHLVILSGDERSRCLLDVWEFINLAVVVTWTRTLAALCFTRWLFGGFISLRVFDGPISSSSLYCINIWEIITRTWGVQRVFRI
jgi:hypothetical protein